MAFADSFSPSLVACNEILAAGSVLLVGAIANCTPEPTVYVLEATAAATVGAVSISIKVSTPLTSSVTLRKGAVLTFGASNTVIVAAETVVTNTATPVAVEPLTTAITLADTAQTWGLLRVLAPTNLPLSSDSSMVSRYSLSDGLQGSEVKTRVNLKSDVEIIASPQDKAFESIIFPASQGAQDIYVTILQGSGANARHAFGLAKIMSLSLPAQNEEIIRPTFSISMGVPYALTPLYTYCSVAEKATINSVRKFAGLSVLV